MNRACHHARVVDSRRARLLSFHHPPYLLHDAVLSVVEVAVNVEWVELVADADRELVGEHIAGRSKRDLCRRAAHLHDPRRRVRLLCTRRQHHAAHEPSWTELDSTGLDWSSQTGVLNTCFPMAVFTAHELTEHQPSWFHYSQSSRDSVSNERVVQLGRLVTGQLSSVFMCCERASTVYTSVKLSW